MVSVVRTQGLARFVVVGSAVLAVLASTVLLARAQEGPVQAADPSDPNSPSYVNYTAPDELGQGAAEPSIGVNHNSGAVMYQAVLETLRITFDDATDPPSATWEDVSPLTTSITTLDPILHTDSITGKTFVSQLLPPCSIYATTTDDGESYIEQSASGCGPAANFDHQTIVAGPAVNPALSPLYEGRSVYYCSQLVVEAACARSVDGGQTFPQGVPIYILDQEEVPQVGGCAGLHGHLEVGPNGFAYMPNFRCNDGVMEGTGPAIVVSEDDGLTWTIRRVPDGSSDNFDSDPTASVDGDNVAYVAYETAENEIRVATTADAGRTWTPSVDLGAPFGIKNATMPASIAGSGGRAAISFLGTPVEAPLNEAGEPENQLKAFDPSQGVAEQGWHLYVSTTFDGGQTWETVDATPTDPVQRGCIWWGSPRSPGNQPVCTSNPDRNLLDFTEMAVDAQGRVLVGYADGCVRTCVDDPAPPPYSRFAEDGETESDFREDVAVIARQTCGRGIFAEFDADPAGPLSACERSAPSPDPTPPVPSEVPTGQPTDQPTAAPGPGPGPSESARTERVAGDERVTTAVAVSQASFPDGTETVLLARSDDYPDALTGAPLAVVRDAPLLLTDSQELSTAAAEEIARLGAERAVILGGEQAVGPAVVAALESRQITVERVGGGNRYATAAAIAQALPGNFGVAFLAEGGNPDPARGFPDPLSAAPYAAFLRRPILLTGSDELPTETTDALRDEGIRETVVVGGPAAVGEAVVQEVRDAGHGPRRLAGADRYATSVAVSDEALAAGMDTAVLWLATGTNWPDALTAGPAVAAAGDSFLLVDPGNLEDSPATAAAIEARAGRIETVRLLGGTAAVSEQVERQVQETLGSG